MRALEYALVALLVGGAVALAAQALGSRVAGTMNGAAACLERPDAGSCSR